MNRVTNVRFGRILAVTGGLALTGCITGGALGGLILCGYVTIVDPIPSLRALLGLFTVGATYGAAVGTVLAPIASWTLLRRIPLGRAIAEAAAGTFLGAIGGGPFSVLGPVLGGVVGFVAATLHLRFVVARRLPHRAPDELASGDAA